MFGGSEDSHVAPVKIKFYQSTDNPPPRLDKALARECCRGCEPVAHRRPWPFAEQGSVRVNGQVVTDPRSRADEGQEITWMWKGRRTAISLPEEIPLNVVFRRMPTLIVIKQARWQWLCTPHRAALRHAGQWRCWPIAVMIFRVGAMKSPRIVHRIVQGPPSGLLVVAKSDAAHATGWQQVSKKHNNG